MATRTKKPVKQSPAPPEQVTSATIAPELATAVNEAFAPIPAPPIAPDWSKGRAVVPSLTVLGSDGLPRPVGIPGNNGRHGSTRAHDYPWHTEKGWVIQSLFELGAFAVDDSPMPPRGAATAIQIAAQMYAQGRHTRMDRLNRARHYTIGMAAAGLCRIIGEGQSQLRWLTPAGVAYGVAHGVIAPPAPAPEVKETETVKEAEPTTPTKRKRK